MSAQLEARVTRDGEPVYYVRDWAGDYLADGRAYRVASYAGWARRITSSSQARLLRIINACNPQIGYTWDIGFRVVAQWPPE